MADNFDSSKRRSRIAAFLLNVFLMPAGYVYAGRVWVGILATAVVLAASVSGFLLSVAFSPGLFFLVGDAGLNLLWVLALAACFGLHAAWLAGKPSARMPALQFWGAIVGLPLAIYVLAGIFRAFWPIPTYVIPSIANWPTLDRGDIIAVEGARALCGRSVPKLGDLIVYRKSGVTYIKRVVAGAGDTVAISKGDLFLNGVAVKTRTVGSALMDPADPKSPLGQVKVEKLGNGTSYKTLRVAEDLPTDTFGPYRVPSRSWFVLGDSRDNSVDSRTEGPVPQQAVCGVAFKIVNARLPSRIGQALRAP